MKEYIKTLLIGLLTGAVLMQLINMAVQSWIGRPFTMGGEFLLPALVGLVGYIGWMLAETYFHNVKRKEIYKKGFDEGRKINKYKIIIPISEEKAHEKQKGSRVA